MAFLMSIPRILHQTTRDKHDLSEPIRRNIERIRALCTEWDYRLYDDADVRDFIQKNCDAQTLLRYDKINPQYGAARYLPAKSCASTIFLRSR